jgi:EmrB/QacA subfamily drug resistance transporter
MQPQPVRQADQAHSAPAPKVAHAGLIIVATSLGLMMDGIDLSGVSVANPVIAADLHANLSQLQWVTNGYLLAMAVALITAGKLGDRFGHRRIFLVGMIGFAASSGLVGLSTHITTMIVFRILQGLFGAALMPNSLAILRLIFPPDELKRAIGFSGGMVALATTGGPAVGGVIVDYLGWRWIFFTNLPVAAIVVGLTLAVIPGASAERITRPRIDVPGVLLLAVSLGGLVWGLIASPVRGWSDPEVLAALVIAAIAAVLFVVRQQTTPSPLLPLDLFRSLPFSAGASILVLTGMAIFGTIFYLVFYLQHVKALSPSETGFVMLACTAMFIFSAPASGILNQRFGARLPLTIGSALIIAGAA